MAKSGKRRQYGWHMYKGPTQIIFTAGSAIQRPVHIANRC